MTYHSQHPQLPSLSPHVLLIVYVFIVDYKKYLEQLIDE